MIKVWVHSKNDVVDNMCATKDLVRGNGEEDGWKEGKGGFGRVSEVWSPLS